MRVMVAVVVSGLLFGCVQAQRPVRLSAPSDDAVGAVARALTAEGHEVASVDPVSQAVYTRWQDTGFLYGQVQGEVASIVRRYVAVVSAGQVTLRADEKRCARGGFSIGDLDVRGPCEVLDGVPEDHQRELDQLGARLAANLGTGAAR